MNNLNNTWDFVYKKHDVTIKENKIKGISYTVLAYMSLTLVKICLEIQWM